MSAIEKNRGMVLALVLMFLALFVTGTMLYLTLTTTDFKMSKRSTYASKAFFLAESGIHKTLYKLREVPGYAGGEGLCSELMPMGEYEVSVGALVGSEREVTSTGYFPSKNAAGAVQKKITVTVSCPVGLPTGFFDNAMFAGGSIELKGNSVINGNIKYGDSIDPEDLGAHYDGDFPMLDFVQLKALAESQVRSNGQNNLYTAADIAAGKAFPTSFWFDIGEPSPHVPHIPNVVYIETDLELRGNSLGTLCGFFVVAGDVITNSVDSADTTINGNGTIDGVVYTLGDFRINGGGNGLGVTGGAWARDDVRMNGNAQVSYSSTYMDSIETLSIGVKPQILSWRETN
jgi:hypothetical protein